MRIISFAPDVRSLLAKRGAYSGTDCTMMNKKSDAYKEWMRKYRQSDKYRAYMKEYMSKYRKQGGDATKKRVARSELTKALLRGDIKRNPCVVCNNDKSQGHHPDYDKPLEVIWLCRRHHQEVHSGQLPLTAIPMKKTVKAFAIIGKKDGEVHAVAMKKNLLLGNTSFPVVPCTITYSL